MTHPARSPSPPSPAGPLPAAPPLELRGFSFWYGATQALHEVDLAFAPRAVTALIGPSGCGKSTLLRAINRLDELTPGTRHAGEIRLDGEDVRAPGVDVVALRQRVGMVFQRWNPFRRSIYENVAYGPRLLGVRAPAARGGGVEAALRRAALWGEVRDRLHASALTLSGGQQQRLCIARALANEPRVLLLDEPTSALDPVATQRIEELLYELREQLTIVLVTHNLHQAARVSDYTAFLDEGRAVELDASDRLFTNPREPRTEAYITGRFG